jgi:RND family efflux transporter MFP subunit
MRSRAAILLAAGLVLLLGAGCGRSGAQQAAEREAVTVRTEAVSTGAIRETISFSGEVAAGSEIQVVPKTAGRITRVAVAVGQEVEKGDLLVQLEAEELALAVSQAEAALEMARANLKSVKAGGTLAQLQATARQAEAGYLNAGSTLERMELLYREGAIALQQLETARLQAQVAESQYSLASEQLAVFERGEGQVQVLAAQVRQAEAGLEIARLNLSRAQIVAPVAGRVQAVNAETGNMASPAMPVITMLGPEGVTVTARLTEKSVVQFSPGKQVEVEVPAADVTLSGKVQEISPGAVTGARAFLVKIRVAETEALRPGMFARVRLPVAENPEALLVPRASVLEREGRYFVFTLKEGRAIRREVTIGLQDEKFTEVVDGVALGEAVITAGQQFLEDGAPVRLEGEKDS